MALMETGTRQGLRFASIGDLLAKVKQTYEFILDNTTSSKINATKDVLLQIDQIVQECAQLIAKYSETKSVCTPLTFKVCIVSVIVSTG